MKCINILLVEDNEGDIYLTREALEESTINNKLLSIKDGKKPSTFLNNYQTWQMLRVL